MRQRIENNENSDDFKKNFLNEEFKIIYIRGNFEIKDSKPKCELADRREDGEKETSNSGKPKAEKFIVID